MGYFGVRRLREMARVRLQMLLGYGLRDQGRVQGWFLLTWPHKGRHKHSVISFCRVARVLAAVAVKRMMIS